MLYHGAVFDEMLDEAYHLVEDYFARKSLAKLGMKDDFNNLSDFEVQYLTIVDQEVIKLESENVKNRSSS